MPKGAPKGGTGGMKGVGGKGRAKTTTGKTTASQKAAGRGTKPITPGGQPNFLKPTKKGK